MATLHLPASLRNLCQSEAVVTGPTIGAGLEAFVAGSPRLRPFLFEGAQLRPFVVILQNGRDIKALGGLSAPMNDTDTIRVVASVAGG